MRAGQAGPALRVKDRLGRSSNCSSLLHTAQGQARIELTHALGLTRSRFIEDRAPAALLHQIKAPLKKIEALSIVVRPNQLRRETHALEHHTNDDPASRALEAPAAENALPELPEPRSVQSSDQMLFRQTLEDAIHGPQHQDETRNEPTRPRNWGICRSRHLLHDQPPPALADRMSH